MPVTLNVIESTTELGQEIVEIVLASSSTPGPAGPGVPVGGTDGQVLTKTSATDYATAWEDPTGGAGGGAPDDVDYLVGTASGDLSAEIVVGTSPGGELGGTWASPTVDTTHSGSSHASVQAAAEATAAAALLAHTTDSSDAHDASAISSVAAGNLAATDVQAALNELDTEKAATSHAHAGEDITSGTVADARIASTITRDSEWQARALTAGNGLAGGGDLSADRTFSVNVDDSTIEINSDTLRVKDGGITAAKVASDVATQAELDAHVNDTSDAHDASAISVADSGTFYTATDVEGVLAEIAPQLGGGGAVELEYTETTTSDTSVTATTSGTAETFITASAVVLDGSTRIAVEFYSPLVLTPGGANNRGILVELWGAKDGGAAAAIAVVANPFGASNVSFGQQVLTCNYLTPASGSWVYSIRVYVSGGTGQVLAGSGGAGAYPAAYLRISEAPGS